MFNTSDSVLWVALCKGCNKVLAVRCVALNSECKDFFRVLRDKEQDISVVLVFLSCMVCVQLAGHCVQDVNDRKLLLSRVCVEGYKLRRVLKVNRGAKGACRKRISVYVSYLLGYLPQIIISAATHSSGTPGFNSPPTRTKALITPDVRPAGRRNLGSQFVTDKVERRIHLLT